MSGYGYISASIILAITRVNNANDCCVMGQFPELAIIA
jgi:hypothetical protein